MPPLSSHLLYPVPRKAKLTTHGSLPGSTQASSGPHAWSGLGQERGCPLQIPPEHQQGRAWVGGTGGLTPTRMPSHLRGEAGAGSPPCCRAAGGARWGGGAHMGRQPCRTHSGTGTLLHGPSPGLHHGAGTLPWPGSPVRPCWRSQGFWRPVPCQLPAAPLAQASAVPLCPVPPSTGCSLGPFLHTCLQCRFYFFPAHGNRNRGIQ